MRARSRRLAGCAAALVAGTVLAVAGCGGSKPPLRIGVVVDCVGINRPLEGAELAGAELPLVQRGAKKRGGDALAGIDPVTIAGRRVELVRACTELYEFSTLTAAARRLVEHDGVDVVVAGASGPDELTLRDVAARYPRVSFVSVVHGPREVTLQHPARNAYRPSADEAQGVAGLGTYAYRTLGWRRAAVAVGAWDIGWSERDAFMAEFCALGGRVTAQIQRDGFDPAGRDVRDVPRGVDGVAVFSPALFGPEGFVKRLAKRLGDPRRIVVGPGIVDDPGLLGPLRTALAGASGTSYLPPDPGLRSYLAAMRRRFPDVSAATARSDLVLGYRTAVETVARAFVRAGGDPARLPAALARIAPDLPAGAERLDANRSAVVSSSIVRIGRPGSPDGLPALTPVGTVRGVDQSIGGLLAPSVSPSSETTPCRRASPPPWAG
jgi:branched-chain amino acid transport system substrate-binding protein